MHPAIKGSNYRKVVARTGNEPDLNRAQKSLTAREKVVFVAPFLTGKKQPNKKAPYFSVGLVKQIRRDTKSVEMFSLHCS